MKMSGAEIIINLLERQKIKIIAGIPGGANLPLYHALSRSKIRHILARHEQGAGYIAHGIARSTGETAVCFATSGPGVTNLLTAVADAYLDSTPLIAITGQVSTALLGTDAFQEVDTFGLTLPITKHNFLVRNARQLLEVIPEAFRIAGSGRPGPVVIDVPKNVQTEEAIFDEWPTIEVKKNHNPVNKIVVHKIASLIEKAERPVLYIGGGVVNSGASGLLLRLVERNSIPVVATLMGLGSFPAGHPLFLGMLGMHGARYTNYILNEADLLLALGVRFDDRATGDVTQFCNQAKIVHIDIDPAEHNKLKKSDLVLTGDLKSVLEELFHLVPSGKRPEWIASISQMKVNYPFPADTNPDQFHPLNLIKKIGQLVSPDTIITTDVGQHQMWVAQSYPFRHPRTLLTSGGLGTMGFGLPAAIGAALANPNKQVICFSGDGSILMNLQELATLAELNLNVTVLILNNGLLGLVRQQQELFYDRTYIASRFTYNPDFAAIARGFGLPGIDLSKTADPEAILAETLAKPGPWIVNIPIDPSANVLPMVPPGAANNKMIGG